ncbi:DNA methyltransferase [Rodentibacter genomosp. 1]|uniref:DNA methyltransferase n=1 Tax=Rodentibacter genomosp. 1 TaxID=1908264 RepID=UPI001ABFAF78|nr:DNA methyltransferase [Rodentibacter genomosp. 1]
MAKKKIIVWALFDSGNGCYTQAAKAFPQMQIYPIGIDIKRKNQHFISLNLGDYSRLFGNHTLFKTLDRLPKPDVILASPPCESWSLASGMKNGNACWRQIKPTPSHFRIRKRADYTKARFNYDRSFLNRINGELCIYNTIEIIKRYQPKIYIIENPAFGRIWDYIEHILGFGIPFDNLTYYSDYGYIVKKPTKFKSNISLRLSRQGFPSKVTWEMFRGDYNERSNIPLALLKEIYPQIIQYLQDSTNDTKEII